MLRSRLASKKPATRPKPTVLPPKAVVEEKKAKSSKIEERPVDVTQEIEKAPEVIKIIALDARVENPIAQQAPPIQTENIASTTGGAAGDTHEEECAGAQHVAGKGADGSGVVSRKETLRKKPRQLSPIRVEDTLGDIYYKTYDESRANEPHASVWNLKQSDTLTVFSTCREWMVGAFPPGEVRR
ncbi:hypothetical protein Hanom_Chr09g00802331 [Helianthus anomalus]